ncbi:MAG: hypothetical protein ABSH44_17265 [Bryobacteraceae bacterium]|jgi:uncharacterized membrane protein YhaH (DUF805 family)
MTQGVVQSIAGLLAIFVLAPILVIPYWRIFSKAGFSGWLALLILIPIINLILLCYIAFSKWKSATGSSI